MIDEKWKPNYMYSINSTVQVESRESYIKSLRATALYMEDQVTDDDFHLMALKEKSMPSIDTYKIKNLQEL